MAEYCKTLALFLIFFVIRLTLVNGWCWGIGVFECEDGTCIDQKCDGWSCKSAKCDGIKDCAGGEDEVGCTSTTATPSTTEITTERPLVDPSIFADTISVPEPTPDPFSFFPSENEPWKPQRGDISEFSAEVDPQFTLANKDDNLRISCKLKGSPQYKIEWFRLNNMSLPKNANQNDNGILTISKVNFENSGYYICIALDEATGKTYKNQTFVLVNTVKRPAQLAWEEENSGSLKVARDTSDRPRVRPTAARNYPEIFSYRRRVTTEEPREIVTPSAEVTRIIPCPENITLANGSCCYTKVICEPCKNLTTSGITTTPEPTPIYNYFQCGDGTTIKFSLRCNSRNDCHDGSDEYGCPTPGTVIIPTPNQTCAPNEFRCDGGLCIPSYEVCDGEMDCIDESDEVNCHDKYKPKIILLPKARTEIHCVDPSEPSFFQRHSLTLECKFVGSAPLKVFWKKYEGNVPAKCRQSSVYGHGTLTCDDFEPSDQGAYSCVAENPAGSAESQPKSIVVCSNPLLCSGFRVVDEHKIESCLDCYCSNKTSECNNIKSNLKNIEIDFPETKIEVFVDQSGKVLLVDDDYKISLSDEIRKESESITYCSVHESTLKTISFVKSYGRNINVPRYNERSSFQINGPDLIIRGDGLVLTYSFNKISHTSPRADVRFWRGNWKDVDGNPANRIQIMRVLAHLDLLLIRCEYEPEDTDIWDGNEIIKIESATIAEYSTSVSYLEKCECPIGYSGLSCESCAAGYIREEGTQNCIKEPPPAPPPCPPGYKGENCANCDEENGYKRHPISKECVKEMCHEYGSVNFASSSTPCICKENVKGNLCDECKFGSFNLNNYDPSGCTKCWCNGVTSDCKSLDGYRSWIASTSYGGYNSSDGRHFWLLPSEFNGNRLASYGGNLEYTIRYAPHVFEKKEDILTVEILNKKNVTIIGKPRKPSSFSDELSWKMPIREDFWRDRDGRLLSRSEILQILVNVQAIYIESPYHLSSGIANLTSVSLDTVDRFEGTESVLDVEECRCPEGYEGLSCESCADGYTRDQSDITKCVKCNCDNCDPEKGCNLCPEHFYDINGTNPPKGPRDCRPCPCNNNEKRCLIDDFNTTVCYCNAGFSGMNCETKFIDVASQLKVTISPNKVKNKRLNTKVVFNCSYDSTEEMIIKFKKVYADDDGMESMDSGFELPSDINKSNKFGSMRSFEVVIDEGLKHVECYVFNLLDPPMIVGRVMAVIEGTVNNVEVPEITNCYVGDREIKEGEPLDLFCEARGIPRPKRTWFKTGDSNRQLDTTDGVHSIENATLGDAGKYFCQATNIAGSDSCTYNVIVKEKCLTVDIQPRALKVEEGDTIILYCKSSEEGRIEWSLVGGRIALSSVGGFLPSLGRHSVNKGRLSITKAKIEDSGSYLCTFTGKKGSANDTALVVVEKKRTRPTAYIRESDQEITRGSTLEIHCDVTGYPEPTVIWTAKYFYNVEFRDNNRTLVINNANVQNEGIYECRAQSTEGNATSRILISVKKLERPQVRIHPHSTMAVLLGADLTVECKVVAGSPPPKLSIVRLDRKGINAEIYNGVLSISKVNLDHHGKYLCIAENPEGRATAQFEIDVLYAPRVKASPSEVREIEGRQARITCEAQGNPKPDLRFIEERKSPKRNTDSFRNITNMLHQNRITLEPTVFSEIVAYVCVAENSVGIANATIPFYISAYAHEVSGISITAEIGSPYLIVCEGVPGVIEWSKLHGSIEGDVCPESRGLNIPSVQIQHRGTYICRSKEDPTAVKHITLQVVGFVNKFEGDRSFLVLPVKPDPNELNFEIAFRPDKPNGILLVEKHDQLFSVYLEKVKDLKFKDLNVFKLNVNLNYVKGEQPLILSHKAVLELNIWYTAIIRIKRDTADLLILGDDGKEIGLLAQVYAPRDLDLSSVREVYLGGTNLTRDTKRVKHVPGLPSFGGCVSRFIQGKHEYKITEDGLYSYDVTLCKRCSEIQNPCDNAGVCIDAPSQYGFVCVCPNGKTQKESSSCPKFCQGFGCEETNLNFCQLLDPCNNKKHSTSIHGCVSFQASLICHCAAGYSGTTCENAKEYSFHANGDGYVKLDSYYLNRISIEKPEVIEIEFIPNTNDGILLWQGDETNHLYIALVQGRLEYVYFNQNQQLKVTSGLPIVMGSKNRALTTRRNSTVELEFAGELKKSEVDFSTNRVHGDVYLGGLPNMIKITKGKFTKGYSGCVSHVILNADYKVNLLDKDIELVGVDKGCLPKNEIMPLQIYASEELTEEDLNESIFNNNII